MINLNFVALTSALLFIVVYLLAFLAWDNGMRLSGGKSRKLAGIFFAVIVFLLLMALGVELPDYMGYIIPTAFVALVCSVLVTFAKVKDGNANAGGKGNGSANAGPRVKF